MNNGFTVLFFILPCPDNFCFPTFHQQLVLSSLICNLSAYLINWDCWVSLFVIAEISGNIPFSYDKVCYLCTNHFTLSLSLQFLLKLLISFIFHWLIYLLNYYSSSVSPIQCESYLQISCILQYCLNVLSVDAQIWSANREGYVKSLRTEEEHSNRKDRWKKAGLLTWKDY